MVIVAIISGRLVLYGNFVNLKKYMQDEYHIL